MTQPIRLHEDPKCSALIKFVKNDPEIMAQFGRWAHFYALINAKCMYSQFQFNALKSWASCEAIKREIPVANYY